MADGCEDLRKTIRQRRFEITFDHEDIDRCMLNFRDKRIYDQAVKDHGEDRAKFLATSTVVLDKNSGRVDTNLVSPLDKFCELYLTYCCEDNENACRVHIDPEEIPMQRRPHPRIGLEVKPINIERFKEALDDFFNCIK